MVQIAPLTIVSLTKTIPGRLFDSFFPASQFSIWKTRTNFLLQLERDQTDGSPLILSLVLKIWPRSFVDCSNQLGSLKILFVSFNCRDCPKKCCITWFIFDSFCHNLCTLSFLTKLCPHWTLSVVLLRTAAAVWLFLLISVLLQLQCTYCHTPISSGGMEVPHLEWSGTILILQQQQTHA